MVETLDRGQFEFYRRYAESLDEGADLLATLDTPKSRVLTLDFVSPFSSLTGLPPPDGGTAWMHDGRNFDREFHFPDEEILGGVDVVMIPKRPIAESTTEMMQDIYGAYLRRHFRLVARTELWRVYQRREAPPARTPDLLN